MRRAVPRTLRGVATAAQVMLLRGQLRRERRRARDLASRLQQQGRYMGSLLRLSKALEEAASYWELCQALSVELRRVIGFQNAWIFLTDEDDPETLLLLTFVGGLEEPVREAVTRLPTRGDAMIEEIIASRHPVVVTDARTDPRTNKETVARLQNRTIVNVPLRMADRLVGAMGSGTFGDEGTRPLSDDEVAYLDAVGSRAAVALDRLRQLRKRQEAAEQTQRLVLAMQYASDGVLICDAEGRMLFANAAMERLVGRALAPREADALGSLRGEAPGHASFEALDHAVREGRAWSGQVLARAFDGRAKTLDVTFAPVRGLQGGAVAVARDVTHAANFDRARRYFTLVSAHEMRTPLTKLALSRHLLEHHLAGHDESTRPMESCVRALGSAYASFQHIQETTSILTQLSAAPTLPPIATALHPVLERCLDTVRKQLDAERRSLDVGQQLDVAAIRVRIDPTHLALALSELLSNSVKYTPDGRRVRVYTLAKDGVARIEVADEGIGMTREAREQLFTPYFSPEDTALHSSGRYKFRGGGLGLGLAITKLIAEFYGGSLEVLSGPDAGTTSVLILPLAAED